MLGCSIQLVHTQVLGQRCGVLIDLLPILYPQFCGWVHCVPWPYRISESCKMLSVGECPVKLDAKVDVGWKFKCLVSMYTSSSHFTSLLFRWNNVKTLLLPSHALSQFQPPLPQVQCIGPRCSCPGLGCFQSSSIPGGLLGWPSHQHSHTSWRWYQGGHGCRFFNNNGARTDLWGTPFLSLHGLLCCSLVVLNTKLRLEISSTTQCTTSIWQDPEEFQGQPTVPHSIICCGQIN